MKNKEIAKILYEIADFLEMKDVDFKPRAYRKAARNIEALTEDIESIHERGELEDISGVGESIAKKIVEYLDTGKLGYYEELKADLPVDIEALTNVEGLGPKRVKKLHKELGIESLEGLERTAMKGKIADVEGFGEKIQENILRNIEAAKKGRERQLIGRIFPVVQDLENKLLNKDTFDDLVIVGSYRRKKATVGDIDILGSSQEPKRAMDDFCELEDVKEILVKGKTKSSIILSEDLQVDLRIVNKDSLGSALMYFTGSKDHNVALRNKVKRKNWKLNEYGLFDEDDKKLASETEEEVYRRIGLEFIPPELRENTGEIEAAEEGNLPDLVKVGDIRGDLQVHSNYSDGSSSLEEVAKKAEETGLKYLLISDHGPSLKVAGGLDREEFEQQKREIEEINEKIDVEILHGIEANIVDGELDISSDWCEACDILTVALHNRPADPTQEILSVFENYPVDILVHPLGRQIYKREPIDLDLDRIVEKALKEHIAIEINAQPERLDLDWRNVKKYRNKVKFVISTDAHSTTEMDFIRLGVSQARRGWCESRNILNTRPIEDVRSYLHG